MRRSHCPIGGDDFSTRYMIEGAPVPVPGREPSAGWQIVSWQVLRCDRDAHRRRTRVPRRDTARLPRSSSSTRRSRGRSGPAPIPSAGRLRLGRDPQDPWMTVVGVVSDMRHRRAGGAATAGDLSASAAALVRLDGVRRPHHRRSAHDRSAHSRRDRAAVAVAADGARGDDGGTRRRARCRGRASCPS